MVDAAREHGVPPPDNCLPPIVLTDRLAPFYDAFWELSSTRQVHFGGVGPIPWDVMDSYAERHGFSEDVDLYEDFMLIVRALDAEFVGIQCDEATKERAKAARGGKGGR